METTGREALTRFARERHVHYELAAEEVLPGGQAEEREVTGFQVRLFATPGEEAILPPGSERHAGLLAELRDFAEHLIGEGEAGDRMEVVPTTAPPLYASTEVKGADEVELTVRIRCEAPEHRGSGEDRCIADVRRALHEVGVPRR